MARLQFQFRFGVTLCALLALSTTAFSQPQITAQRLATIPEGSVQFSDATADGQHAVLAVEADGKTTFVLDDKVIPLNGTVPYDAISLGAGGRLAYPEETADGTWHAVVDSKAGPVFDEIMARLHVGERPNNSIIFSNDGKHFAYAGRRGSQWVLVLDGREGPPFSKIIRASFCADGSHLAYVATKQSQWIVVKDEREIGSYDQPVTGLVINADGKRLAWIVGSDQSKQMVIDGQAGQAYGYVEPAFFSTDGRRVAYIAYFTGNHSVVVIDGKEDHPKIDGDPNDEGLRTGPVFSADGKHIAYAINGDAQLQNPYVIDGQVHPSGFNERGLRESTHTVGVSSTGQVVYIGRISEGGGQPISEQRVVIDNEPDAWWQQVDYPVFSPDGKHRAYVATPLVSHAASEEMVVDGTAGPEYDALGRAIFSPDSKPIAYSAEKGTNWSMMLDGTEIGEYNWLQETVKGQLFGIPTNHLDNHVRYNFDSDGTLRFMGTSNGALFRLKVTP